jgi:hypothetical protein
MAEQNNPKVGIEKNFFVMSGVIKYRPSVLSTKADKKPFASFLLLQTRQAGANYKEFTRYYQVMAFDQKVIDSIMSLYGEVRVEIKGNISIDVQTYERFGKAQRVSMSKLIATELTILEETGNTFTLTKKEQGNSGDDSGYEQKAKTYKKPVEVQLTPTEIQEAYDIEIDMNEVRAEVARVQKTNPTWNVEQQIALIKLVNKDKAKQAKTLKSLEIPDEDLPF